MRITIVDQLTSAAHDYNIGSAVLIGALVQVAASKLGREVDSRALALRTLRGQPLSPHTHVGAVCREGGIYTLGMTG
ncbi:MAG TPA: hypothetical protein VIF09_02380 [Polyangiaceae bacterium]